ncbi:MAG: hypothetical protein ISN26_06325, partial [Betaproteobacteria bacterium AqS2]|nr:hypothetical protein [Betaproteobacteria bacterium AqS2]
IMNDDSHLIDPEDREKRVKARVLDERKGPGFFSLWESEDGDVRAEVSYDFDDFSVETKDGDGTKWTIAREEFITQPQSELAVFKERKAAIQARPRGGKDLPASDDLQLAHVESLRLDAVAAHEWAQEEGDEDSIADAQLAAENYSSACEARREGRYAKINSFELVRLRAQNAKDARAARKAGARAAARIKRRVVRLCDALLAKHRIVN